MGRFPPRVLGLATLVLGLAWAPAAGAQARTGAYVARQGDSEVTRERYRFDGTELVAEIEVVARGVWLETHTALTGGLSPRRYTASLGSTAGRLPVQVLDAAFGDSVRWMLRTAGATRRGATAISRPNAVLQALAFSHLAVILLRYNRTVGGVQVLDVWFPEGGRVGQLRMSLLGDSGTVQVSGHRYRVRTDRDGWLREAVEPTLDLSAAWQPDVRTALAGVPPADTLPPPAVRESTVTVMSGSNLLVGTLALPPGPRGGIPLAILIGGSGALDRDGNALPVIRSNSYAQVAWRLAERGIATLRYDPAGVGSSRAGPDGAPTLEEREADAVAVGRAAAAAGPFGPVVLLGHDEGGWVALRAALRLPVAGVALLGVPGRPYAASVRDQVARQLGPPTADWFARAFPAFLDGADPAEVPVALRSLFNPGTRRLARSMARFDPAAAIRMTRPPVLLLQGGADEQVSVRDAELLRAARPDAALAIIPRATHLFKPAGSDDRVARLALLLDPTVPVVPEAVEALAGWIQGIARP